MALRSHKRLHLKRSKQPARPQEQSDEDNVEETVSESPPTLKPTDCEQDIPMPKIRNLFDWLQSAFQADV